MEQKEITIPVEDSYVQGNLTLLPHATGLVLFAHGSGSSRHSARNQLVATALNKAGLSTLLFDLLTPEEDEVDQQTREFRFDIPLLAERLLLVTTWLKKNRETSHRKIGYFGASTGAAAALIAAVLAKDMVHAVVSRGGRADLAGDYLRQVQAPTLLLVGGLDQEVIVLNKQAYEQLTCTKEIQIIPGASHLFEEAGTLEQVSQAAALWFLRFL
jgi:putative phosphoribosyl transferase